MTERDNKRLRAFACSALTAARRARKRALRLVGVVRELVGDDAYERYLAHWYRQHADESLPLDRKAFFKMEQERKWNGIRRCC